MKTSFTTFFLAFIFLLSANSQNVPGYWTPSSPSRLKAQSLQNKKLPTEYKVYTLDINKLKEALKNAPSDESVSKLKSAQIIQFPNSAGQLKEFNVIEASVMDPALAAKYPDIKSYAGRCSNDPTITIRFDVSPAGFHGLIFSDKGSDFIDPLGEGNYMVYDKSAMGLQEKHFECLLKLTQSTVPTSYLKSADDGKLRKFRLALACTGEYTQYFLDGTETTDAQKKGKALAAMNTTMTRVNGVFEKDFCLRLIMIANDDAIIYIDPNTDPWTTEYNTKTQQTIDNVIGSANYDIGHLVMKNEDNGNAGCIGCVCVAGSKGSGFTSHTSPLGDPFDIDYVVHEMGHQLGANHTFTFSNEGTIAQMEPGSGSTIMGYAGITGQYDVQPHSDDYFHAISIQQVTAFIKSASCAQSTTTGNTTPTATAGADYTIPKSTPFELTGDGSDADAGDALTFCWEQIDNRTSSSSSIPKATQTSGPVFRSYKPSVSKTRMIPALSTVLAGSTASTWEVLPSVARTLNFRLTVRDNHPGGGSNAYDDMKVTVNKSAGPFAVTAPNTAVSWTGGTSQTVTWNVASTTASPVSCANVIILLSTDGGQTFPTVLAASTQNDGTEAVTVPNVSSTQCRVKVKAVGNIFFDISNANFTITSGTVVPVTGVSVAPTSLPISVGQISTLTTTVAPANASNQNVTWSSSNTGVATVSSSGAVTGVAVGTATITVTTVDGGKTATCQVTVSAATCNTPTGLAASGVTSTGFNLAWTAVSGATSYDVSVNNVVTNTTSASLSVSGLTPNTAYSVMVRTNCSAGSSAYSAAITVNTTSISYCTASGGVTYEWIGLVQLGSINNSTGANAGYGNFTALSTTLARGASQTIYLKPGFKSTTYSENWKVWIDYNNDGDFADTGEDVISGSSSGSTTISASFVLPATATLGNTRMRVEMRYGATPASCGTFTYGEVEDYTVNISASAGRDANTPVLEGATPLDKNMSVSDFSVFPNPTRDKLFINLPQGNVLSVKVIDLGGKDVPVTWNNQDNSIPVDKLASGVYIVVIETERGKLQKTFVKE